MVTSSKSPFDVDAICRALWADIGAAHMDLGDVESPIEGSYTIAAKRVALDEMRNKFLSKFVPLADPSLDERALNTFYESNRRCSEWQPQTSDLNSWQEQLVGTFLSYMNNFFETDLGQDCDVSWGNISLHAKPGPGVANGSYGTSHYEKFYSGPLCASSPALHDIYRADIALWPEEFIAEQIRSETFGPLKLCRGSSVLETRSGFIYDW